MTKTVFLGCPGIAFLATGALKPKNAIVIPHDSIA
jgi:hypothetical protein